MSHIPKKRQRRYNEYRIPPLMDMRDLSSAIKLKEAYGKRKGLVPKRRLGRRDPLNRS